MIKLFFPLFLPHLFASIFLSLCVFSSALYIRVRSLKMIYYWSLVKSVVRPVTLASQEFHILEAEAIEQQVSLVEFNRAEYCNRLIITLKVKEIIFQTRISLSSPEFTILEAEAIEQQASLNRWSITDNNS